MKPSIPLTKSQDLTYSAFLVFSNTPQKTIEQEKKMKYEEGNETR
jgi:hypothetical protein